MPLSVVKDTVGVLGAKVSPVRTIELLAILLTLPTVKVPAEMLITPLMAFVDAVGVKVAVYTLVLVLDWVRPERAPPETVTSETSNPVGAALKVKVTVAVLPALKDVLSVVITTPGAATAVSESALGTVPVLPATSKYLPLTPTVTAPLAVGVTLAV